MSDATATGPPQSEGKGGQLSAELIALEIGVALGVANAFFDSLGWPTLVAIAAISAGLMAGALLRTNRPRPSPGSGDNG